MQSISIFDINLSGFTFYKMTNLDNRIANADQLLTQDVDRFCEGIVELYSNLSKVGLHLNTETQAVLSH